MAARTNGVWDAVVAAIAGIDGAPTYTNDLSADDRVQYGPPPKASSGPGRTPPAVYVDLVQLPGRTGDALTHYRRTLDLEIVGFVQAAGDSRSQRRSAAVQLMHDITLALEADRSLGGLVVDQVLSWSRIDNIAPPGVPQIRGTVRASWRTTTGV